MQQTLDLTETERQTLGQVAAQVQLAQQRMGDVASGVLAARGIVGNHTIQFSDGLKTMTIRPVQAVPD